MNTKYRYKPTAIDAIQFHCTPEGIAAIAVFGGTDFTGINNQRVNGTPAAAYVNGLVIPEGSWLLRNATGVYKVLKDSVFTAVCEPAIPDVEIGAVETPRQEAEDPYEIAKKCGAVRYYNGKPCYNGHIAERYTTGKGCVVCAAEARVRNRKKAKATEARQSKQATTKALKACTGFFAPLAASISH